MNRGEFSDREVAHVTLQLDEVIALRRRAAAASLSAHLSATPTLSVRPSTIELMVLTALAQTFGPSILDDASFLPVLDSIAERGAVELVQRVLWGSGSEDDLAAQQLAKAHVAFETLSSMSPEVFMSHAFSELDRLGIKMPRSSDPSNKKDAHK